MGDQRRSDSDKEAGTPQRGVDRKQRDEADAEFTVDHAVVQKSSNGPQALPEHSVAQSGKDPNADYVAARDRRDHTGVIDAITRMSTRQRKELEARDAPLPTLAKFLRAREVMLVADLIDAGWNHTLMAILVARPSRDELRAYLMFVAVGSKQLEDDTVNALKAFMSGASPLELFSEVDDLLGNSALAKWYFATTDPKTVARQLLASAGPVINLRAHRLNQLGAFAWQWLSSVDATMATGAREALATYKRDAEFHKQVEGEKEKEGAVDDSANIAELQRLLNLASAGPERRVLQARRPNLLSTTPLLELLDTLRAAKFDNHEQLDWILDKPGLTVASFRVAVANIYPFAMTDRHALKLHKLFPSTPISELFPIIPEDLSGLAIAHRPLVPWLINKAQPEVLLHLVSDAPGATAFWCEQLVVHKVGFDWVRQLGARANDTAMRQLALNCTDASTVEYINARLLGDQRGVGPDSEITKAQPIPAAAKPNGDGLAHDLDTLASRERKPVSGELEKRDRQREADAANIAVDVDELSPVELKKLASDASRLFAVLRSATPRTLFRILEHVQVELHVVLTFVMSMSVDEGQFINWCQTRPISEIRRLLFERSHLIQTFRRIVKSVGVLEALPNARPLVGEIAKTPEGLRWLMMSPAAVVLPLLLEPAVLDSVAASLSKIPADEVREWLPSASALRVGFTLYPQLAARMKRNEHRELLDELSKPVQIDESEQSADSETKLFQKQGVDGLVELIDAGAGASALMAFCHSARLSPGDLDDLKKSRIDALHTRFPSVSPDTVFHIPLDKLIALENFRPWIAATVPAFRLVRFLTSHPTVMKELVLVDTVLDALPRGRALTLEQKSALHQIARTATGGVRRELFEITFDIRLDRLTPQEEPVRSQLGDDEIEKIWNLLEKVPRAHVDERSISDLVGVSLPASSGTAGQFDNADQRFRLHTKLDGNENFYTESEMSEEEAISTVGSRGDFERFLSEGRLVRTGNRYTFKQVTRDKFSLTVLHEVGHAVDNMLGLRTELVYNLAGWKVFPSDDFEQWAEEIGGWDKVSKDDQAEISKVARSWLKGGARVPARELSGSGVITRNDRVPAVSAMDVKDPSAHLQVGDKRVSVHQGKHQFRFLSSRGYNATPTHYALTDPAEYFAECYAHYYYANAVDGRPKGEGMVPWMKTWFDENVDKLAHNPQRMKG